MIFFYLILNVIIKCHNVEELTIIDHNGAKDPESIMIWIRMNSETVVNEGPKWDSFSPF